MAWLRENSAAERPPDLHGKEVLPIDFTTRSPAPPWHSFRLCKLEVAGSIPARSITDIAQSGAFSEAPLPPVDATVVVDELETTPVGIVEVEARRERCVLYRTAYLASKKKR